MTIRNTDFELAIEFQEILEDSLRKSFTARFKMPCTKANNSEASIIWNWLLYTCVQYMKHQFYWWFYGYSPVEVQCLLWFWLHRHKHVCQSYHEGHFTKQLKSFILFVRSQTHKNLWEVHYIKQKLHHLSNQQSDHK